MATETVYKVSGNFEKALWVSVEDVRNEVAAVVADLANTKACRWSRSDAEGHIAKAEECVDAIDRHAGDPQWEHATGEWLRQALHYLTEAEYQMTGGFRPYHFQRAA
jgi:hypothetical protein